MFGGIRTIDVYVRRLRTKVGTEHEQMIGMVRQVGYKFVRPAHTRSGVPAAALPECTTQADDERRMQDRAG